MIDGIGEMAVQLILLVSFAALLVLAWLYRVNSVLAKTPEEVEKIAGQPWTNDVIQAAYEKCRREGPNFQNDLPLKQNRRYIVFGGSGQSNILPAKASSSTEAAYYNFSNSLKALLVDGSSST